MNQINFKDLNRRNEFSLSNYLGGIEMEFIKKGKNYLIKDSNGVIVSEEEKLKLEQEELILKDIEGCGCQGETTKKIKENKKKITALQEEADNDTIKKTAKPKKRYSKQK